MKIYPPLCITSRLLPGARIGEAEISIEYAHVTPTGQQCYHWFIDLKNSWHCKNTDLHSAAGGGTLQEGLESLLGFLGAFAEAIQYEKRTGEKCEESDLFPVGLTDWAIANVEEITMLECTLMDKRDELIVE